MIHYPNILLIAGSGRNVGKTLIACSVISDLARNYMVSAVKISPHFHEFDDDAEIIFKNDFCIILNETKNTNKDSSRMLQAGADQVLFLMCEREKLKESFKILIGYLNSDNPIIVESGGLYKIIEPGVFVFINGGEKHDVKIRKESKLLIVENNNVKQFNNKVVKFSNGVFYLTEVLKNKQVE